LAPVGEDYDLAEELLPDSCKITLTFKTVYCIGRAMLKNYFNKLRHGFKSDYSELYELDSKNLTSFEEVKKLMGYLGSTNNLLLSKDFKLIVNIQNYIKKI
jgi:hypothetical protein